MEGKNNIQKNQKSGSNTAGILKLVMTGKIFVSTGIQKHLGYIFFIFFLAVFYIGYLYKVESIVQESKRLNDEIKSLRTHYIHVSTELMRKSKKSEIIKQIQDRKLTLKEAEKPFVRVKIK
ncbi:MAG: hypothetical protein LBQ28_03115 [Prevotellaceae bacterium]|nr:hypothetical protein [Prevotellaceae bacterium]